MLIITVLAWHIENDALNRHNHPIWCPPGITSPGDTDCTPLDNPSRTTEGENK